jgi:hypothetical protein
MCDVELKRVTGLTTVTLKAQFSKYLLQSQNSRL